MISQPPSLFPALSKLHTTKTNNILSVTLLAQLLSDLRISLGNSLSTQLPGVGSRVRVELGEDGQARAHLQPAPHEEAQEGQPGSGPTRLDRDLGAELTSTASHVVPSVGGHAGTQGRDTPSLAPNLIKTHQ